MSELIKEVVPGSSEVIVPSEIVPIDRDATLFQTLEYIIYFVFGALEILLVFRFILRLAGASLTSGFVDFIYSLSGIFIAPFEGIFRSGVSKGLETASVLELSTLIAIAVYIVLAWGLVQLLRVLSGKKQTV